MTSPLIEHNYNDNNYSFDVTKYISVWSKCNKIVCDRVFTKDTHWGSLQFTGSHQIVINATHIPAPVPHLSCNIQTQCLIENLASINTITHHLLTVFLALWEKCLSPNW